MLQDEFIGEYFPGNRVGKGSVICYAMYGISLTVRRYVITNQRRAATQNKEDETMKSCATRRILAVLLVAVMLLTATGTVLAGGDTMPPRKESRAIWVKTSPPITAIAPLMC